MAARRPAEATGCAPAIAPVTWLHAVAAFSAGEPTWASSLHYLAEAASKVSSCLRLRPPSLFPRAVVPALWGAS